MHTHKSDSTDKHAQQPEDIDFTVKLIVQSALEVAAKLTFDNAVYLFTSLGRSVKTQVWTLYQNTHVNLVLQSIFARKRNYCKIINVQGCQIGHTDCSLCLALRFWDLA